MKFPTLIILLVFLSSCGEPLVSPLRVNEVPVGPDDTCEAAQYGVLIGQDATALERVLRLGEVRIIRPSDAVTLEYRAQRINFILSPQETIRQITCG